MIGDYRPPRQADHQSSTKLARARPPVGPSTAASYPPSPGTTREGAPPTRDIPRASAAREHASHEILRASREVPRVLSAQTDDEKGNTTARNKAQKKGTFFALHALEYLVLKRSACSCSTSATRTVHVQHLRRGRRRRGNFRRV
eukprot:1140825-Rhodomonas_salina.2